MISTPWPGGSRIYVAPDMAIDRTFRLCADEAQSWRAERARGTQRVRIVAADRIEDGLDVASPALAAALLPESARARQMSRSAEWLTAALKPWRTKRGARARWAIGVIGETSRDVTTQARRIARNEPPQLGRSTVVHVAPDATTTPSGAGAQAFEAIAAHLTTVCRMRQAPRQKRVTPSGSKPLANASAKVFEDMATCLGYARLWGGTRGRC